jgi:hypothetical protein
MSKKVLLILAVIFGALLVAGFILRSQGVIGDAVALVWLPVCFFVCAGVSVWSALSRK